MRASQNFLLASLVALLSTACADTTAGEEGLGASSLVTVDACEADEVLSFLNEPTLTYETLTGAGVHPVGARNLVHLRAGADGVVGTEDDVSLETIGEVDAVPGIGDASVAALVAHVGGCDEGVICTDGGEPVDLMPMENGTGYCRSAPSFDEVGLVRGERLLVCVSEQWRLRLSSEETCDVSVIEDYVANHDPAFQRFCGLTSVTDPCGPVAREDGACCMVVELDYWCE